MTFYFLLPLRRLYRNAKFASIKKAFQEIPKCFLGSSPNGFFLVASGQSRPAATMLT